MRRLTPAPASLLSALLLCGCATGNEIPPQPDLQPEPDRDALVDRPVDRPPAEPAVCGNGQLDPGEVCDPGIAAGRPGACPQSAVDCDDRDPCTTDTFRGSPASCSAACGHEPVAECCGNGIVEGGEECDDGNTIDSDSCSNACKLPGGHLLVTEVAVSPSEAEFVEIFNPTTTPLPLADVYLSDRADYYQIATGALSSESTDFVAHFPAGSSIAAGAHLTVSIHGSLSFKAVFSKAPDFELHDTEPGVPDMVAAVSGSIGSQAGLTDTGELIILFSWNGSSDLVEDLDYVVWKGTSAVMASKSSAICVDGPDADTTPSCYKDDTPAGAQSFLAPTQQGGSLQRCNYLEGAEKKTGGNGVTGHDETSEPFDGAGATWKRNANALDQRTPGGPPRPGFCSGS